MDGFGGYKTAATEQLPEATTVMDPSMWSLLRRQARFVPPTCSTADLRASRSHRGPALPLRRTRAPGFRC